MIFEVHAQLTHSNIRDMKRWGGFWHWDEDAHVTLVCMPDAYYIQDSEDFWMWHTTTWDLHPSECIILAP